MNNTRNNRKNNAVVAEVDETVVSTGNGGVLNKIKSAVGLSGGKRNGTRKGRKGSRKGTRKAQAGGKGKLNPYMHFAAEQRKKMGKTSNVVSQAREIGKRWRALSEAEKAKY